MRTRFLFTVAAVTVMLVGGQPLLAQQMSPYGMVGGYPPVAMAGYPSPYPPMAPPQFDIRQAALASTDCAASDCTMASCTDPGCNTCGQASCAKCCGVSDCWCHCVAVFGEFLYLQARNADVAYGVPIDGGIAAAANPVQVGRIGLVDQDYDPGFRFGVSYVLDGCSSITLQYTWLESLRHDEIDTQAPNVIRSLVSHPGTLTAAQDFLSAQANHNLRFDFLDVDYRRVLSCSDCGNSSFLVGARMGQFSQDFLADFSFSGTESVQSEIDFYGAGVRLGLEGERFNRSRRWLVYGKTAANFLAGEFTADYRQGQSFDPAVVDTTWKAGRLVPMLDLEIGAGWQSRCGTWRITGGYMISAWYNMVKTDEWIDAVQNNNFVDLSGGMTFDGLVLRCEGRF